MVTVLRQDIRRASRKGKGKWLAAPALVLAVWTGYWWMDSQTPDDPTPPLPEPVADVEQPVTPQVEPDTPVVDAAAADAKAVWDEAQALSDRAGNAFADGRFSDAVGDGLGASVAYSGTRNQDFATQAARRNQPREGQDWPLPSLGLTMKWIPPGTFMMGSTQAERDWAADPNGGKGQASWFTDERDPVSVRIADGFWMGQTTITRGMFHRFVQAENYRTEAERNGKAFVWIYPDQRGEGERPWNWQNGKSWHDPGFDQDDTHPAVCITWNDAMTFCVWLTQTEREAGRLPDGYEYRLPGEAEWEYAARRGCGGSTKFWWGDNLSDGRGRLNGAGTERSPTGTRRTYHYDWDDGFFFTSPVDHYGTGKMLLQVGEPTEQPGKQKRNCIPEIIDPVINLGQKSGLLLGQNLIRLLP